MKSYLLTGLLTSFLLVVSSVVMAKPQANQTIEFLNSAPSTLPFSEAVKVNGTLYLSGQIGFDRKAGKLVSGGTVAEAHQTLKNIKRSLNNHGYAMSDVVKCLVILTDINDFAAFNEVYKQYFKPPYPARSAFAASALALNSHVEIECIAAK